MNQAQCTTLHSPATRSAASATQTAASFVGALVRLPVALFETLLVWQERAEERARLRQMDDRMLSDIGLGRGDVEREASIPFWRAS